MTRIVATTAAILLLAAAADDGRGAPLPPERPTDIARDASEEEAPLPPPRPQDLGQSDAPSAPSLARPAESDPGPCVARLAALGIRLEPVPALSDGDCGVAHPFRLKSVSDTVTLGADATVQCPVAEALARWAGEAVAEEARRHLGATLTSVQVGTSYQCRGRNRQAGAMLSEHAFANAVDIAGFSFDKGPAVMVGAGDDGSPAARFLAAARQRACSYFTTVLGPGSDPYHQDHLHLDLRARRGDHRLCQ